MEIAFHIGSLAIRWYSIMMLIAVLAGVFLASREAARRGEDPNHLFKMLLLLIPLALIGARLYHVIDKWDVYSQDPVSIFGGAGLGIFGAVAGGIIGMLIYTRWKRLSTLRWLDIGAPALILGQAIGRWGNFFNQEVYGRPSDLPWAIFIDPAKRVSGYESFSLYHPLFLYESILNFWGCFLLLFIGRRFAHRLLDGDIFFIYVIYYSTIRFCLEWLRIEPWTLAGFPTACWICLMAVAVSVAVMVYRRRRRRPHPEPARNEEDGE